MPSLLRTLLTGASTVTAQPDARFVALETHVRVLYEYAEELRKETRLQASQLQSLRQDEARRAAEHATMVDQLDRLYKRVSARIAREPINGNQPEESTLDLRRRLGR